MCDALARSLAASSFQRAVGSAASHQRRETPSQASRAERGPHACQARHTFALQESFAPPYRVSVPLVAPRRSVSRPSLRAAASARSFVSVRWLVAAAEPLQPRHAMTSAGGVDLTEAMVKAKSRTFDLESVFSLQMNGCSQTRGRGRHTWIHANETSRFLTSHSSPHFSRCTHLLFDPDSLPPLPPPPPRQISVLFTRVSIRVRVCGRSISRRTS